MDKKIILILPVHFNFYEGLVKNFEVLGFKIELLFLSNQPFKYKNFFEKTQNFINKSIFLDKNSKQKLIERRHNETLVSKLNKIEKCDFALIIRPDFFSRKTLELVKEKCDRLVAYQWDGFNRFPKIKELISIFDFFFVFDVDDYYKYQSFYPNLKPITNFYFDYDDSDQIVEDKVYFIGSYLPNRIASIIKITNYFENINVKADINIVIESFEKLPHQYKQSNVNFQTNSLSYLEVLEKIKSSKYVLDFSNNVIHNGLSFRTFEAIYFKKKLITNNNIVENYDFYHPNNIFVWDENNENKIDEFLKLPYQEIDSQIILKYGFSNWIKYVLDIPIFKNIIFPEKRNN